MHLARHKQTSDIVAIKQLEKQDLIKQNKQEAVMREKAILKLITGLPFLVQIKSAFMDTANLYFVFEHCMYGTLSNLISLQGKSFY